MRLSVAAAGAAPTGSASGSHCAAAESDLYAAPPKPDAGTSPGGGDGAAAPNDDATAPLPLELLESLTPIATEEEDELLDSGLSISLITSYKNAKAADARDSQMRTSNVGL